MAFLASLLSSAAGQSKARHDAYLDALATSEEQRAVLEAQRRYDAEQARLATTADRDAWRFGQEQKDASEKGRLRDLRLPASLAHPLNHGKKFTNEDLAQQALADAQWFESQNDPDKASGYRAYAQTYGTLAATDSRAELGTRKQASLDQFRQQVLAQRSGQFTERERRLAQQYTSSFGQHAAIANLNHSDRLYVAQLAGAIRVHVNDDNTALREALAEYTQTNENFRAFSAPRNQILTGGDPTMPQGVPTTPPQFPPVNVNVYGGGGASGPSWSPPSPPNQDAIPTTPGAAPRPAGRGSSAPKGLSAAAQREYEQARDVIAQGAPVSAVLQELRKRAASEGIPPQEVDVIAQRLAGAAPRSSQKAPPSGPNLFPGLRRSGGLQPGVTPTRSPFGLYGDGGSNATSPFLPGS